MSDKYDLVLLGSGQRLYKDLDSKILRYICPQCYEKNKLEITLQELNNQGFQPNNWRCTLCDTTY